MSVHYTCRYLSHNYDAVVVARVHCTFRYLSDDCDGSNVYVSDNDSVCAQPSPPWPQQATGSSLDQGAVSKQIVALSLPS